MTSLFCNYRKTVKMTLPSLTPCSPLAPLYQHLSSTSCCSQYSHAELLRKVFQISQLAQTRPKQSTQAQLDWKFRYKYTVTYTCMNSHTRTERDTKYCVLLRFVNARAGGRKQQAGYMAQFLIVNLRDRNTYTHIHMYIYTHVCI